VDALERRCGHGGIRNDQSANWSYQHAMAHPEANRERFKSIEAKLDELRSYLYANRESIRRYAEAYRNGERISTAHVESTVNQLINWRMCKKHQMGWSRSPTIASRQNRHYQRATGPVYRASFSLWPFTALNSRPAKTLGVRPAWRTSIVAWQDHERLISALEGSSNLTVLSFFS
jgi:hypothetical protein